MFVLPGSFHSASAASAVAACFAWRLENSRLGHAWTAIRDDEDVAQALGINLVNVKLLAYGLGAGFAGVAGAIFSVMLASIFPHSFQLLISILKFRGSLTEMDSRFRGNDGQTATASVNVTCLAEMTSFPRKRESIA